MGICAILVGETWEGVRNGNVAELCIARRSVMSGRKHVRCAMPLEALGVAQSSEGAAHAAVNHAMCGFCSNELRSGLKFMATVTSI